MVNRSAYPLKKIEFRPRYADTPLKIRASAQE